MSYTISFHKLHADEPIARKPSHSADFLRRAAADAFAASMLAVSAGLNAVAAARQPHYVTPVYVYCPYGC